MLPKASVFTSPPAQLMGLLAERLPSSLTILRRLQFALRDESSPQHARIIVGSDRGALGPGPTEPRSYTVAYADFSAGPDAQTVLYSTLEDGQAVGDGGRSEHEQQLACVVDELVRLRSEHGRGWRPPPRLLLGSLHADVRAILERTGRLQGRSSGIYDKWLFKVRDLPPAEERLPDGMYWGRATFADCRTVVARTDIPRTADFLVKLPNLVIKLQDHTPIAWGFLGVDGGLMSLHCEESYRRKGLARNLAIKLLRESTGYFTDDGGEGWTSADVSKDNSASQAVCRSLNGQTAWVVSW
ncbi:hypothetical protein CDD83_2237 [Cordyceps sp. RAO-2017]|nr:hypothetical protein CDD83_2237 [Cordyceps sp. RAO-2017]